MRKIGLLLAGLAIAFFSHAQTLKIQGGISLSQLDWKMNGVLNESLYNQTLTGYSFFAGMDYWDKNYFSLSSNVGLIRKGGKDKLILADESGVFTGATIIQKAKLDYFTVNTTFNLKYRMKESFCPFIHFGPRIDFLIGHSSIFDFAKEEGWLEKTSYGLVVGGGMNYYISKLVLGIKADYYVNFNEIADWTDERPTGGSKITGKTFLVNLTIGYALK